MPKTAWFAQTFENSHSFSMFPILGTNLWAAQNCPCCPQPASPWRHSNFVKSSSASLVRVKQHQTKNHRAVSGVVLFAFCYWVTEHQSGSTFIVALITNKKPWYMAKWQCRVILGYNEAKYWKFWNGSGSFKISVSFQIIEKDEKECQYSYFDMDSCNMFKL